MRSILEFINYRFIAQYIVVLNPALFVCGFTGCITDGNIPILLVGDPKAALTIERFAQNLPDGVSFLNQGNIPFT